MEEGDAARQIEQMVAFIINEAKDKAAEIETKSQEDFNVEKLKTLQDMKEKIRASYRKKAKEFETQRAIEHSSAVNKARLRKIAARQMKINEAVKSAQKSLGELPSDATKYAKLCVELTVQAMLRLMEPEVKIRCRQQDLRILQEQKVAAVSEQRFLQALDAAGLKGISAKVDIDKDIFLLPGPESVGKSPTGDEALPSCSGGVVVASADGKVVCDNTFDTRLSLVVQQRLPQIRRTLYED